MLKFLGWTATIVVGGFALLTIVGSQIDNPRSEPSLEDVAARMSLITNSQVKALIQSRAVMGQAAACGLDQDRILRLMTTSSAAIEVLSSRDPTAMRLGDDMIKLGGIRQKAGLGAPCNEVETAMRTTE